MRIMIINPDYGMTREEMELRCQMLSKAVGPDVELSMECLTKTRVYLDSALDAVMLSFDVDGDTIWKNGARDYPGGEHFLRANSVGNYGPNCAVRRILDILDEEQIKSTFFVPAKVMEDHPELCQEIDRRGHEIGHHGYHHERYVDFSPQEQREIRFEYVPVKSY